MHMRQRLARDFAGFASHPVGEIDGNVSLRQDPGAMSRELDQFCGPGFIDCEEGRKYCRHQHGSEGVHPLIRIVVGRLGIARFHLEVAGSKVPIASRSAP